MYGGENEHSLKKIIDFIRMASIVMLLLHYYGYLYYAFEKWGLTIPLVKRILINLYATGLFRSVYNSKLIAVGLLLLSLIGTRGKKDEKINKSTVTGLLAAGLVLYWVSTVLLYLKIPSVVIALWYILTTSAGYLLILAGGSQLSRLIKLRLNKDIFNQLNETFPQEERLLENEFSINLPAQYNLKGKIRRSWINIINPFRGLLVLGTPGSRW